MCCLVCRDWEQGKLTTKEALQNLGEMIQYEDENTENMKHYFEVANKIIDKEVPSLEEEDMLPLDEDLDWEF